MLELQHIQQRHKEAKEALAQQKLKLKTAQQSDDSLKSSTDSDSDEESDKD